MSSEVSAAAPPKDGALAAATTSSNPTPTSHHTNDPVVPPVKEEAEDDCIIQEEEEDEEEALLCTLEKQAEEEHLHQEELHLPQPKEITAAPKLLRDALEKGQVKADESEEEEELSEKKSPEKKAVTTEEEKKGDDQEGPPGSPSHRDHVHARTSQLDFLLNKASQYSSFIASDLDELQRSLTETAARKLQGTDKKRKRKSKEEKSKRAKKMSEAALQKAQDKDQQLRVGKEKPIFIQPPNLADGCQLKDYQLEGVRWLASLFENGVSGILADEMGLGKTIQVIALIAYLLTQNVSGPFLIVAPLATLPNWVREFEKWLPQHNVIRYHGPQPEREAMLRGPLNAKERKQINFPFIVTSYEVAIRDQRHLEKLGEFTYLIVDEGQRLKNHRCTLLQSLKRLKAANRLLLSGTPIQNNLDELWSLLNFVNPQIFDDLSVFQSWFGFKDIGQHTQGATSEEAIMMEQRTNRTISKLHEILRPFLLRRIKKDVLTDMPPKKEVVVYSGMSKLQLGYADLIEKGVLRDTLINQGIEQGRTLSQTNKMMNHRKNVNHPFLFGEPIDPATGAHLGTSHPHILVRASGKFALLDRMLQYLHTNKHQVLIFSQMTAVLNVMEDYLNYKQWKYCRIDGSTNIDERQRQMDVFNAELTSGVDGKRNEADDRSFVFLLSTRAGGLGINLTCADTCIIFDSDFNPFQDSQAQDRCHRIGQTRPVAVYRLLTANSVDIDMMSKALSKRKLERMAITGGDFRKAGRRSRGEMSAKALHALLEDDIKDLESKGGDVENIKISDEEFANIMDRQKLFTEGPGAIPTEGKMYDVIAAEDGDLIGTMNA